MARTIQTTKQDFAKEVAKQFSGLRVDENDVKKVREKDRHVKHGGWRDPSLTGTYVGARQIDNYPGITIGIIGLDDRTHLGAENVLVASSGEQCVEFRHRFHDLSAINFVSQSFVNLEERHHSFHLP